MAKIEVIPFRSFMDGSYKEKKKSDITALKRVITATSGSLALILPKAALAATVNSTFGNVHGAIMNAFDAGVVLVIIFSGASWALGHRTKALEILIGVSCGYILARHSIDIRDFLKGI
ncbi:TPA: glycosyltransferase [Bacillus cereus]|uniref:glycosyltransferase n=1 Tax=Bacillus cereus group sp. BfR-BA-01700 TaxID=3094884 RepID=UPI00296879EC|nr:glycosyltransferase [Bacillus cereus group sp. BfR-BA-01700]MDX5840651.1 glycosyltransferase [Bacillus cereus group sp. BfR-BA-01700]HDR7980287.1 glycosyltransferase [Bacillus cereus]HDR8076515.1 glycosyltransferase [Bacillus cereus]HDR8514864.1 glycosyltransferase [Bacillus cereus]